MALFAPLDCRHHFFLPVGQGHTLYVEESGNPDGIPVVVLHGGPGGGCSPFLRRFFDPQRFRIILYDQRGAGKSLPLASTDHNSTDRLCQDLETLREHLGLSRWMLFGGSWGSTLALAYGKAFPGRVTAMVLRGVFLCRPRDLDWLYGEQGAARLFPEAWQALLAHCPPGPGTVLERYHRALIGEQARDYARPWCNWESTLALMNLAAPGAAEDGELCMARQEAHYFIHGGFLDRPLLDGCEALTMPVEIIHGSRDYVCPPEQAWALHRVLPNSRLQWVDNGGHSSADPAIAEALVAAVARIATGLRS
ncbi:proline iminopeptidase (PIP) [Alcanivorax hongdengensis A-11-3]|uniref:Proline iminopeptidase n=1 Tax=Alcanivorax hongdengensis A-11-3 TaxID=1177179 RepID=L0WHD2_9GAMM|nr:prolyl aminopeptidase [Alcanivorax hongdengensis]EKF76134.1 proline iminopeptidase (PIP) [Alcanivorax hongdengensis A-11-3]